MTNFKEPNAFVLSLPRADVPGSSEFDALHKQQLLACFDIGDTEHDDWAQVNTAGVVTDSAPAVMTSALPLSASIRPAAHVAATLPKADALPRPDHLLATPPYYLVVSEAGRQMEITATHSATLELIKEYLNKWCRLDHTKTNKVSSQETRLMISQHISSSTFRPRCIPSVGTISSPFALGMTDTRMSRSLRPLSSPLPRSLGTHSSRSGPVRGYTAESSRFNRLCPHSL